MRGRRRREKKVCLVGGKEQLVTYGGVDGRIKLQMLLLKEEVDVDMGVTIARKKMSWWRMLTIVGHNVGEVVVVEEINVMMLKKKKER